MYKGLVLSNVTVKYDFPDDGPGAKTSTNQDIMKKNIDK